MKRMEPQISQTRQNDFARPDESVRTGQADNTDYFFELSNAPQGARNHEIII